MSILYDDIKDAIQQFNKYYNIEKKPVKLKKQKANSNKNTLT